MADELDGWIRGEALGEGGQAWTYFAYQKGDETRTPFVLKLLKHKSNPARLKRNLQMFRADFAKENPKAWEEGSRL